MAIVDLVMPKMGESIVEATIITWLKEVGDQVEAEEPILEVATDKVDSEVPSTVSGKIVEILHHPDEVVAVGGILARIEVEGGEASSLIPPPIIQTAPPAVLDSVEEETKSIVPEAIIPTTTTPIQPIKSQLPSNVEGRFYSPLVRNIARAEGISLAELNQIQGSATDGRVTKLDLHNYIAQKKLGHIAQINNPYAPTQTPPVQPISTPIVDKIPLKTTVKPIKKSTSPPPSIVRGDADEVVELDRMRRIIAQHMKRSQNESATVTTMVEADATHLVHWRNRQKNAYQTKYGEKLTFSPLFTEAVIKAIGDFPTINASLDGDNLILKKNINIGIATAMENGNLIVPVIKQAQSLNLVGLTAKLNDITGRARKNALRPDEIRDGSFTISNIGTFGNIMGTPIINQPELAILALGAIKKKPVIRETSHGDIIAIRHMMFLSLSFDHRVIDGYLGGVFLKRIAHYIEAFDPNRPI